MAKEFVYSKTFQLTPSRRATKFLKESKPFLFISTHALTEGDIHLRSFARKCRISTHALTEGDQNSTESGMHGEDFNSRPHGGRRFYLPSFPPLYDFNSRPHGGRQKYKKESYRRRHFNSRPHGRRLTFSGSSSPRKYFNSRPHGGRLRSQNIRSIRRNFNSRPHGGRREKGK